MRRFNTLVAILGSAALAACGGGELAVTAEIQVEDQDGMTSARQLGDLEVQLLPYDRDQVFDSMAAAHGTPEPEIPADLQAQLDEIQVAQEEWRAAETRWGILRDTLQKISERLETLPRNGAEYRLLFQDFNSMDGDLSRAERQMNAAFARFTDLQGASVARIDSITVERENWGDRAFEGVGEVITLKIAATGLEAAADTTDAAGAAMFAVKPGAYWIYARYERAFDELYWNVPVTLEKGAPVTITLSEQNAVSRPLF